MVALDARFLVVGLLHGRVTPGDFTGLLPRGFHGNGIDDAVDLAGGTPDCNANGIPDSCEVAAGVPLNCGGTCYANCDGSTATPLLTANDFQCFVNAYAIGQAYANCDGSTGNPILTANDFTCFVNAYAAGCS